MNSAIEKIHGREILDSRGNPTVEVDIILKNGTMGRAAVPSGASTGDYEAIELRDKDNTRFLGKGVRSAVNHINTTIADALKGMDVTKQVEIDQLMINLDDTHNKSNLGANALLGVSMAAAHTGAKTMGKRSVGNRIAYACFSNCVQRFRRRGASYDNLSPPNTMI